MLGSECILGYKFPPFQHLLGFPCIWLYFSLVAFRILSLTFVPLIMYDMICLGSSCSGPSVLPVLDICFLLQVWNVFIHNFIKYLFDPSLSLSPPSGTPIMWMLVHLILSQRCLKMVSVFIFLLAVLIGWFPLFCLPNHLFILLHCLALCLLPLAQVLLQ